MSVFNKKDYANDTKRITRRLNNRVVMKKEKITTDMKTVYSICPRCSKKGYVRQKGYCKLCKFKFQPSKPLVWQNGRKTK